MLCMCNVKILCEEMGQNSSKMIVLFQFQKTYSMNKWLYEQGKLSTTKNFFRSNKMYDHRTCVDVYGLYV